MWHVVVMGVTSCGKSTVASALAQRYSSISIEADDLHGIANIEKMRRGEALTDEDRWPWLERVANTINAAAAAPAFIACSALRRAYRDYLQQLTRADLVFIHLHADRAVIKARMELRQGHFMPVTLLDSQLDLLEPLGPDETGVEIDLDQPVSDIVQAASGFLGR